MYLKLGEEAQVFFYHYFKSVSICHVIHAFYYVCVFHDDSKK